MVDTFAKLQVEQEGVEWAKDGVWRDLYAEALDGLVPKEFVGRAGRCRFENAFREAHEHVLLVVLQQPHSNHRGVAVVDFRN